MTQALFLIAGETPAAGGRGGPPGVFFFARATDFLGRVTELLVRGWCISGHAHRRSRLHAPSLLCLG